MLDVPPFDDTYTAFGVMHMQTAFYLLFLGYILTVVCFVSEILWHRHRTKICEPKGTSLCHG